MISYLISKQGYLIAMYGDYMCCSWIWFDPDFLAFDVQVSFSCLQWSCFYENHNPRGISVADTAYLSSSPLTFPVVILPVLCFCLPLFVWRTRETIEVSVDLTTDLWGINTEISCCVLFTVACKGPLSLRFGNTSEYDFQLMLNLLLHYRKLFKICIKKSF